MKVIEMNTIPFKENIIGIYPLSDNKIYTIGDNNEIYIKTKDKIKIKTLEENHKLCYRTDSLIAGCELSNDILQCISINGDLYKLNN